MDLLFVLQAADISIHALLAEGDEYPSARMDTRWKFLSTPSLRRATRIDYACHGLPRHISIHALLAEGDVDTKPSPPSIRISIHALLAEGDIAAPAR